MKLKQFDNDGRAMPKHVHLVLWPPEVMKLVTVVGEIKPFAAKEILNHLSNVDGQVLDRLTASRTSVEHRVLWQRRCYDHNCWSEKSAGWPIRLRWVSHFVSILRNQ